MQHEVLNPTRQRLGKPRLASLFFWPRIGAGRRLRGSLAVDVDDALVHLDMVPRQADQPLDVVQRGVARQLEYDDIPAFGRAAEDATLEGKEGKRKAVLSVTVGELGDEEIIAYQQSILHRSRRDVEGLIEEGAHNEGNDECLRNDLGSFAPGPLCRFADDIAHGVIDIGPKPPTGKGLPTLPLPPKVLGNPPGNTHTKSRRGSGCTSEVLIAYRSLLTPAGAQCRTRAAVPTNTAFRCEFFTVRRLTPKEILGLRKF